MATKTMKTTPIKGRPYVMVNERVKAFRELFPNYSILTEITSLTGKRVIMKATILNEDGRPLATGHAYEDEGSSKINETSFIENCETSAIGRALGACGIGIDEAFCSGDELLNALDQQSKKEVKEDKDIQMPTADNFNEVLQQARDRDKKIDHINELLKLTGISSQQFIKTMGVNNVFELSDEQIADAIKRLEKKVNESAGGK